MYAYLYIYIYIYLCMYALKLLRIYTLVEYQIFTNLPSYKLLAIWNQIKLGHIYYA